MAHDERAVADARAARKASEIFLMSVKIRLVVAPVPSGC